MKETIIDYEFSDEVTFRPFVGLNYEKGVDLSFFGKPPSDVRKRILVLGESVYSSEKDEDWNEKRGDIKAYVYKPDANIEKVAQSRSEKMVDICEDGNIHLGGASLNITQALPILDLHREIISIRKAISDIWGKDQRSSPTYTKFINAIGGDSQRRKEFWDSVAFYEYVQWWINGDPRECPTEAAFQKSDKAFFEVLAVLKPDIIIAWGNRLYDKLPESDGKYYGFKWAYKGFEQYPNGQYHHGEYVSDKIGHTAKLHWVYHPSTSYINNMPWSDIIAKEFFP